MTKNLKLSPNPQNNWLIADIMTLADYYQIDYRQPGTSHVTLSCKNGLCLTIPAHKPIKPIYIKKLIELIEALNEE